MSFLVLRVRFALCFMSATLVELFNLESAQGLYLCAALVGLVRVRQLGNRSVVWVGNECAYFNSSISFLE